MEAALQKAKVLVGVAEEDALARAALAVQYSEFGSVRRIEQIVAYLSNKKIPVSAVLTVDAVRAIVVRETGTSIERDDPLLLILIAMQDMKLDTLMDAIHEFKIKNENVETASVQKVLQPETGGMSWWSLSLGMFFGGVVTLVIVRFVPELLSNIHVYCH